MEFLFTLYLFRTPVISSKFSAQVTGLLLHTLLDANMSQSGFVLVHWMGDALLFVGFGRKEAPICRTKLFFRKSYCTGPIIPFKSMSPMTYFLQVGPTSLRFHHKMGTKTSHELWESVRKQTITNSL